MFNLNHLKDGSKISKKVKKKIQANLKVPPTQEEISKYFKGSQMRFSKTNQISWEMLEHPLRDVCITGKCFPQGVPNLLSL